MYVFLAEGKINERRECFLTLSNSLRQALYEIESIQLRFSRDLINAEVKNVQLALELSNMYM